MIDVIPPEIVEMIKNGRINPFAQKQCVACEAKDASIKELVEALKTAQDICYGSFPDSLNDLIDSLLAKHKRKEG